MNSPDLVGLLLGLVLIAPTIYYIHSKHLDNRAWPALLVTLPVYYMLFGLLANDGAVILKELLYGLPYVITGLLVWRLRSATSLFVLAIAWLSHGFYDYYHDLLFDNPGVFSWYPAFCALIDIAVAAYLVFYYRKTLSPAPNVE